MTERPSGPATGPQAVIPPETAGLSMGDQTRRIDRCLQLLAHRRRRFSLYHLHRADSGLSIRELAESVEASITPPESSLTEHAIEEAVLRLHHSHLPKLQDAGLVAVDDGHAELASNPPVPIQDWLSVTATVELDSVPPSPPVSVELGVPVPKTSEDLPQY